MRIQHLSIGTKAEVVLSYTDTHMRGQIQVTGKTVAVTPWYPIAIGYTKITKHALDFCRGRA